MPLPVLTMPKIEDDVVVFQGGLNLKTPDLALKPGHVRDAQNWQCVTSDRGGGYERIGGYQRVDGRPLVAQTAYSVLVFDSFVDHPSTWDASPDLPFSWEYAVVKGLTSGLSLGVVFYVDPTTPEFYTGQTYLVCTYPGGIQVGETVVVRSYTVAGTELPALATVGVVTATELTDAPTSKNTAKFLAAIDNRNRLFIGEVPGSGPILGVTSAVLNGVRKIYAFRNWTDGLQASLYEATATGNPLTTQDRWTQVDLNYEVRFTNGGTVSDPSAPSDGNDLIQGGSTVAIKRVVHESGEWDAATAAGRFIIDNTAYVAGAATAGGVPVTLSGAQSAITLQPNGKYQFDVHNFGGQLQTRRIYGADGVNRAFEFDGTVFVPIETKAPQDTPKFIRAHQQHLVVAIGSSIIISGPGEPYKFAVADGALEKATGDEVTGLMVQAGNQETSTLSVFGRNSTGVLYGTSAADFQYRTVLPDTGSVAYMQANLDQTYFLDDRGVMSFRAAQEFGNFRHATVTDDLDAYVTQRKTLAVGCCVSADRSQLRMFFSDGSALYLTLVNGRLLGAMPQFFYHPVSCVWSAEDASGNEEIFAGASGSGYIYKLDQGASFDGEPIEHRLTFAQNFMKAPQIKKKYLNGTLTVKSNHYAEFSVGYRLGYGKTSVFQPSDTTYVSNFEAAPSWDTAVWDNFSWDGLTLSPSEIAIRGKSEAIEMRILGSSDFVLPFTLNSLVTHFHYTRRTRR